MIPEKGKTYKLHYNAKDAPEFTHFNGEGIHTGIIARDYDVTLYDFILPTEDGEGGHMFEEKYILGEVKREDFNTIAREKVICPHCGDRFENDLQMCDISGAPVEYDCEHCEQPFELTAEITVLYSTRKLKKEEE